MNVGGIKMGNLWICFLTWYMFYGIMFFIANTGFCQTTDSLHCQEETRLHQDLFNGTYESRQRPGNCSGEPVNIQISMALQNIITLNEQDEILTASSWIRLTWIDERLTWDPVDYNDLEYIPTDASAIWTPMLILENTVVGTFEELISKSVKQATLSSDGNVFLDFPLLHATSCKILSTYFPFDIQNCLIQFSSQRIPNTHITLREGSITGDTGVLYKQWELEKLTGRSYTISDAQKNTGKRTFDVVEFDLQLSRVSSYHMATTAGPVFLLTTLGIVIFLIPPDSGERISAGVSVLLGLTFFELLVCDSLPPNTSPPLLGIYWLGSFLIVAISVLLALISVNLYNCDKVIKGKFRRRLFLEILPRLCCTASLESIPPPTAINDVGPNVVFENVAATNKFSISDNEDSAVESANAVSLRTFQQGSDETKDDSQYGSRVRYSSASQVECSKPEEYSDYRIVTKTLDRLFVVVIASVYIIFTIVTLTRRP